MKKAPSSLDIADLDAPLIASFLEHLEQDRRNSVATRNSRLAAVHSLFGYLALRHPEHAGSIQRVLAIPPKRAERNLVTYLSDAEANALLGACDLTRWTGRRDHAMFALAIQTGLRISELAGLTRGDVTLTAGACVRTVGKGRKERATPLIASTVAVLKAWLAGQPGTGADPLFPTTTGRHLSRDAIERRLAVCVSKAGQHCPSITAKRVTARTLRHTAAMRLLQAGNRHHRHRPLARPLFRGSETVTGCLFRGLRAVFCQTLCLSCVTWITAQHTGSQGPGEGFACRADRHARLLDRRR